MALIPPYFMNAVVALGNRDASGTINWGASGFFYGRLVHQSDESTPRYATYLVTNKHVLAGVQQPALRANPVGTDAAIEVDIPLQDASGNALWIGHPDPEVDVVVVGMSLSMAKQAGLEVDFFPQEHSATLAQMVSLGMSEGDGLFALGFPMGLVGGPRSAAVVRGGTLAQWRSAVAGVEKSYLVHAYLFPGDSGGPVVSKPESIAMRGTTAVSNAYLIGIASSSLTYEELAISAKTGRPRVTFEENSGLARVFPVDSIEQTIDAWQIAHAQASPTDAAPAEDPLTSDPVTQNPSEPGGTA